MSKLSDEVGDALAYRNAQLKPLPKLHLGCGKTIIPGWLNLDMVKGPGVDIVADLDDVAANPLPIPDGTLDEIVGLHLIEHLRNPLALMEELYRVAAPDCRVTFATPYGSSDDAWEDPTHVRPYFLGSWDYFAQPTYWRADYGYRGDWRLDEVELSLHRHAITDEAGELLDASDVMEVVARDRNVVGQMTVILRAVKPARAQDRDLMSQPKLTFTLAE